VDGELRLAVYRVDPLGAPPDPTVERLAADGTPRDSAPAVAQLGGDVSSQLENEGEALTPPVTPTEVPVGTREGARREILGAIHVLLGGSGSDTFTPAQVLAEMKRRGTGYADSTVRTMITAHMCRNAPDNTGTTYDDLERIDRGVYRLVHNRHAGDWPAR
jgi:hypothetical protein